MLLSLIKWYCFATICSSELFSAVFDLLVVKTNTFTVNITIKEATEAQTIFDVATSFLAFKRLIILECKYTKYV